MASRGDRLGVKLGKVCLTRGRKNVENGIMKQRYHTIIKPEPNGFFVGWVEEIPGAITHGRSLAECRRNLRDALELMLQTHRDEARLALNPNCIEEAIEVDLAEPDRATGDVRHGRSYNA